jgi:hypothetical protein
VTGCTRNPAANFCDNLGYGNSKSNIASITFGPATTGISMPYGEVATPSAPSAKSCTNTTVSVSKYAYGTSNMNIADINPSTGQLCAGNWNRQTAGGVAPYTTCLPTNQTGVALITASAGDVTSNTVPVYVHPPVGSVSLAVTPNTSSSCPTAPDGNQCISQGCTATLDVTAIAAGASTPFCAPNSTTVPDCANVLGAVTYTPTVGTIVTLGTTTGTTNQATANQPGATAVTVATNTANVTGGASVSTAGYFYTCPPKTITLTANGGTSNNTVPFPVTPNNPESITATATDINGIAITGLSLTYASTQPENIPVSSTGVITAAYPSTASVTAYCQPPTCNPAPISQIGMNGNGTPIVSTPLLVKSSGTSSDVLYMGSPDSDYYSAIDFTIGQVSNPVKLPYKPNSMVLDPTGSNLYFGSYHELMVYTVANDASTLSKEDPTVPGVVLAVSPANTTLLINDQNRGIFYLYGVAGGSTSTTSTGTSSSTGGTSTGTSTGVITTYGGVGQRAQFSADGQTVYIVGNNKLYIHNVFTGWSTVSLNADTGTNNTLVPGSSLANACAASIVSNNVETSALGGPSDANTLYNTFCSPDLSLAIPTVGPFVSGSPASESLGFCPNVASSPNVYYPTAGTLQASTDHLVATTNSLHVIGASVLPSAQLTDSATVVPTGGCPIQASPNPGRPPISSPLTIENTGNTAYPLTGYNITSIDQVVASPDSTLAFVTYMGTNTAGSAKLPAYTIPTTGTAGTLTGIPLSGTALSPIAGVFSPNSQTFYVSTTGDNLVHLISTSTLKDTSTLAPGLPDANGNITPAQFLAARVRNQP